MQRSALCASLSNSEQVHFDDATAVILLSLSLSNPDKSLLLPSPLEGNALRKNG